MVDFDEVSIQDTVLAPTPIPKAAPIKRGETHSEETKAALMSFLDTRTELIEPEYRLLRGAINEAVAKFGVTPLTIRKWVAEYRPNITIRTRKHKLEDA